MAGSSVPAGVELLLGFKLKGCHSPSWAHSLDAKAPIDTAVNEIGETLGEKVLSYLPHIRILGVWRSSEWDDQSCAVRAQR